MDCRSTIIYSIRLSLPALCIVSRTERPYPRRFGSLTVLPRGSSTAPLPLHPAKISSTGGVAEFPNTPRRKKPLRCDATEFDLSGRSGYSRSELCKIFFLFPHPELSAGVVRNILSGSPWALVPRMHTSQSGRGQVRCRLRI